MGYSMQLDIDTLTLVHVVSFLVTEVNFCHNISNKALEFGRHFYQPTAVHDHHYALSLGKKDSCISGLEFVFCIIYIYFDS